MKKENPTNILAELEQFETQAASFATVTATYYQELIKNKVTPELADKLTLDFHHIWWSRAVKGQNNE